jgi:hypothetical protein
MNILDTIEPKCDQLTADHLVGRTLTIRVTAVRLLGGEQPCEIAFEGDDNKPYRPGKSMRRVLVHVWGSDVTKYVGRSMTLYRDDDVQFGGLKVGGIRISHMSHITAPQTMALTAKKGSKKAFRVQPLVVAEEKPKGVAILDSTGTLRRVSAGVWLTKVGEVVAKLEDADAVRSWRAAMIDHMAQMDDGELVSEAERLIADRLAAFGDRQPGEEG